MHSMTPENTIQAYFTQAAHRVALSSIAITVGLMAALAFKFGTDFTYPAWRVGLVAWALVFLPWFFIKGVGRNSLSMKDTVKAFQEIKRQSRA